MATLGPACFPPRRLNRYRGRYAEAESRYGPRPNLAQAVQAYVDLARQAGVSPLRLALGFVLGRPLVAAAVAGASSAEQLRELLRAAEGPALDADLLEAVDGLHAHYPSPAP